jgi:hypothetical protein
MTKFNKKTVREAATEGTTVNEISQKSLDSYREKSHRAPFEKPGSRKRKNRDDGTQLAFDKSTGRAKQNPPESKGYNPSANVYKGSKVNEADTYRVTAKSNDDDKGFTSGIKSKADADTMATKMKKQTRKDGAKMYNNVKLVKESKLTEGVLDDMDDDGFMAKRQLYDLAKYSVELHRMIQDTDNLEPWISAKITTAADYIDTVKHYLAYKDIDGAEDMAGEVGLDDIADVDASLGAMAPEMPTEEVMEFEDDEDDSTLSGDDILRMMVARRIISLDMYNLPSDTLLNAADEFAMDLGPMYELGSSDISILMKEFVQQYPDTMDVLDGERAHVYESEKKARSIYKKMLSGLQRKT